MWHRRGAFRRVIWSVAILAIALVGLVACKPTKQPPSNAPVTIFPSDSLTVADSQQATGKRVNLPLPPNCTANQSECDEITLVNQLDGFDLDPRLELGFAGPIDVARVNDSTVYLEPVAGGPRIGINRLVWESSTNTLSGHPKAQLAGTTEYRITVTTGVNGQAGTATFTTMTATVGLDQMRAQLNDGSAYTDAGITDLTLSIETDSASSRAAYPAATIVPLLGFTRSNDVGSGTFESEQAFSSFEPSTASFVAFGSFESPSWLDVDRRIPATPTAAGEPGVQGKARIGFVLVTPAGAPPPGGWPVAVFGPGFTRSKYDVLLAADETLKRGFAVIATDPVGHAYGPASTVKVSRIAPPSQPTITARGRGADHDGDGDVEPDEGVSTPGQPDPTASIALRDGLRQTAADNMALARAVERGLDVDGLPGNDLRPTGIQYYGQSFGGIYGTMLVAADPKLAVGALNVPGGPIIEIARLAPGFRDRVGRELKARVPSLYNGNPADDTSFQESLPLYLDPPVTNPASGAIPIQEAFARVNWIGRSGSPEAFAPLLAPRGRSVLYQFAFGDQTVSNPTSATLMRAGNLAGRTTFYRNDRTPTAACNPHGFLLDPRLTGRQPGQVQIAEFLAGNGIIDPDGAGTVFEVPIANPAALEPKNFSGPASC